MNEPKQTLRAVPLLVGVALLALYVRIGDVVGFQASFGPPLHPGEKWDGAMAFLYVSGGEARFWIAHIIVALPAVMLMAWGLEPRLAPAIARGVERIDKMTRREWQAAGGLLFILLIAWSVVGRQLVLLGLPITDDEHAVSFGARIIAEGHLSIPVLEPEGAFNQIFTYRRDGMVSSMDFPGVLLFDALGVVLHIGDLQYAVASAVGGVAVAYAAGRWLGPRARVLAALIWCMSPMIASLSLTGHAHVASRCFVALAIAIAARLDTKSASPRRDAVLFGLFAGLAFLCRPLESACVLSPIAGWLAWRAVRRHDLPRSALGLAIAGMAPTLALFAWWNAQITGVWYLQARFAPGTAGTTPAAGFGPWDRLGVNLGFNLLMLVIFFIGVPAIAALIAAFGRWRTGKSEAPIGAIGALGGGVALHFVLCLAHDNTGIHSVGPIHMSESAVLLALLVTAGIVRGFVWLADREVPRVPAAVFLVAYLVGWCGLFNITNLASLRNQAVTQGAPRELLEDLGARHAIVIAAPYINLLMKNPDFAPWGSWVLHYPHPDPFFRDDIIFAAGDPAVLHAKFPNRAVWVLEYHRKTPALTAGPLFLPAGTSPPAAQ